MIVSRAYQSGMIDFDDDGAVKCTMQCHDMISASAQAEVVDGTGTAWVFTVIVSNDPKGRKFENHPSSITLTNSAKISAAFSVVGYLWFGVQLTTLAGGDTQGNIYLACKDSPA